MAQIDLTKPPVAPDYVRFGAEFGQKFVVTVDTEEEFDWNAPIRREGHGLGHLSELTRFQQFCEGFGVAPIYLVDYAVAKASDTAAALGNAVCDGRAEIGVHLHPWVNPPFVEEISNTNSFAGNLPVQVEQAKFNRLYDAIEHTFAVRPLIYRAGRYGIGPASGAMLAESDIAIDTSVRALFDYSDSGGPDFSRHPVRPYWVGRPGGLIELPLTTVHWGPLRRLGPGMGETIRRLPGLGGMLARLDLLQRISLTPEGVTAVEAIRGIDAALGDGLPLLVFSFHSPSLVPGNTPYVRTESDLETFYGWWRTIFAYLAARKIPPSSAAEIIASATLA